MVSLNTGRARLLAGAALVTAMIAGSHAPAAHAAAHCAASNAPGGEWPTYGHDYSNTRFQKHEKVISAGDVPSLTTAWTFATPDGGGDITGTPIVSGGCVYVATNGGRVVALNADTGKPVWKAAVPYGGGVSGSVGLTRGRVYVAISRTSPAEGCPHGDPCVGPYVVAFDRRTGALDWATRPIDKQPGSDVFGSPVIFQRVVMIGVSGGAAELGDEADRYAFQGSMNFIDARNGHRLKKTWTIHSPGKNSKDDLAGAGIWSTPAIDRRAKVAYVGTGNPFRPQAEAKTADAVVKLDVDRHSRSFGKILGAYHGVPDEYIPGFSNLPCYDFPGNDPPYYPQGIGSCGDIDLDFGASPNLFKDAKGRKLVGAGQKSGIYHAFDARTMKPAWTALVGPPTAVGGIVGSTAYDGGSIYGPITPGGYLWSVSGTSGSYRWLAPVGDGAHYGPAPAVANGVVYTVDLTGFLDAFDARSGAPLGKRPLILGGSGPESLAWGGVSVARHTIYAAVGIRALPKGYVVAFRPGGVNDVTDDITDSIGTIGGGGGGGGGAAPAGATVIAGPGAASTTYATPVMLTQVGGPLSFTNLDAAQHDVTATQKGPDGKPLFASKLVGLGGTTPVEGLDRVQAGQSYEFFCSIHPGMRGTLIVR